MDAETIENVIIRLGRHDFTRVVALILRSVFGMNAINVDGANDAGSDWRVFKDAGGSTSVAYQDTTQKKQTPAKAAADARKAVQKLGATRYFFLSTVRFSGLELRKIEDAIQSDLRIPATCLGAKEIAQFITESNSTAGFLDAIGAPLAAGVSNRIDHAEMVLHAYSNFSGDRFEHQNKVYDDSLLLASRINGALSKENLVDKTIELLSCPTSRRPVLSRRVDRLLSTRQLKHGPDKLLELTAPVAADLEAADRLYLKELSSLQAAQAALMADKFGVVWTSNNTEQASVHISRAYVKTQLETLQSAGTNPTATGLFRNLGDPIQELRDYLRQQGVRAQEVKHATEELLDQAKDLAVIKKLTRAAMYVSLEGVDPVSSAKAIGAPSWADVRVMLDASVAIPFLCSRLYSPTGASFFTISEMAVSQLAQLGCSVVIPWNYINESASHLLRALAYEPLGDFKEDLRYSKNAYVANYFALRLAGGRTPDSIKEYLANFSSAVMRPSPDKAAWARIVMPDLQRLLGEYGVEFESTPPVPVAIRRDIEIEYTYRLEEGRGSKPPILIRHDVDSLAHIKRCVSEMGQHWILLTWDKIMITVAAGRPDSGWVVSPELALDFAQPYRRLPDSVLCTISHRIARSREGSLSLTADIIDRITTLAGERLQDWEFRKHLKKFRDEIVARVDLSTPDYSDWVDQETGKFLQSVGIPPAGDDRASDFLSEPVRPDEAAPGGV
jgi:hypothetical protein